MLTFSRRIALVTAIVAGLSAVGTADEAKQRYTAIYVTDMHCTECAKKIARKLYAVPGVVQVKADVPKDLAFVVHQKTKDPAPRALWEAVENAGFVVTKMHTPGGVIDKKPQR